MLWSAYTTLKVRTSKFGRVVIESIKRPTDSCIESSFHFVAEQVLPQAAQAQYVWVRASEVIWSEYTRIISKIIIWC